MSEKNLNNLPAVLTGIKKEIAKPRAESVFPLTPTHRKELRALRNSVIGDLNSRVGTIKKLKLAEYEKKYSEQILSEQKNEHLVSEKLNEKFTAMLEKINSLIAKQKDFQDKQNVSLLSCDSGYGDISSLNQVTSRRRYYFNEMEKAKQLSKVYFDEQYGKAFEDSRKKIEELNVLYEEAVNFGDLEMVKNLYYTMKGADKFLEKISNLKV